MQLILQEKGPHGLWQAESDWQKQHFIFRFLLGWQESMRAWGIPMRCVFTAGSGLQKYNIIGMINLLEDDHWDGYRQATNGLRYWLV